MPLESRWQASNLMTLTHTAGHSVPELIISKHAASMPILCNSVHSISRGQRRCGIDALRSLQPPYPYVCVLTRKSVCLHARHSTIRCFRCWCWKYYMSYCLAQTRNLSIRVAHTLDGVRICWQAPTLTPSA